MIRKQSQAKLLMALDAWRKAEKHHAVLVLGLVPASMLAEMITKEKSDRSLHSLRILADEILMENKKS